MKPFRTPGVYGLIISVGFLLTSIVSASADTAGRVFIPSAMLMDMAQNCVVPGIMDLSANADELCCMTRQLAAEPDEKTLMQAQGAWIKMQLAYKRHQMLWLRAGGRPHLLALQFLSTIARQH